MTNLKATLSKLNQNLNILREREAKYAGNAPLELLNQIDDHQQAIDLTRQAITGELDEAEWREELKPLLLACRDGKVVNIEAETYIAGDQIITHIYEAPPPLLPSAEAKERHDLGILLNKVKTFWVEGVLEKSIHNIALIDLGKETQAEAVAHAWEQVLELPDQSRQTLPPDKKISHIFDEMNRALLILGVPGSGKTITLLQLARDLISQAEQDESFSQPVPVVFNLSTWTQGQPLIDWLVAELSAKYQIPKRIGRPWLENNRLLPLLDGLDEVKAEERAASVEAINHFGEEFGLSGLVVCSRLEEYTSLPVRLKLNGAIRLQPLTLEQVYDYLEAAGSKLDALRVALQEDESLQTLAQTPLTLGIMSLAYQDMPAESLAGQAHDTIEARRKHLLDTYIERMFRRKGIGERPYSDEQTKGWLAWLAHQMARHNQTIFLIEQLQPSWLSRRRYIWIYILCSRLIAGLVGGLILGIVLQLSFLEVGLMSENIAFALLGGLLCGLTVSVIDAVRFERRGKNTSVKSGPTYHQTVLNVLIVGLTTGLVTVPIGGITGGVIAGLMIGIIFGLRGSWQSLTNDIRTIEAFRWSWKNALKGGTLGLVFALVIGLIMALNQGLVFGLTAVVMVGLITSLFGAFSSGLSNQLLETKTQPNQGVRLSLRNAILTGLFGTVIGFLVFWITQGLDDDFVKASIRGLLAFGLPVAAWYGGVDVIQHYTLRLILWWNDHPPLIYAHFLDYAAERIFLQKVGGGYIFIHRLLLEHFAGWGTAEDAEER